MQETLATDQFDPLQVVLRQESTPYSRLFITTAFAVVSRIGCLGVNGVHHTSFLSPESGGGLLDMG